MLYNNFKENPNIKTFIRVLKNLQLHNMNILFKTCSSILLTRKIMNRHTGITFKIVAIIL